MLHDPAPAERDPFLHFRCTAATRERVRLAAAAEDRTVSSWLRSIVNANLPPPPPSPRGH